MKNVCNALIVGKRGLIIKGITTVLNEITLSTGVVFEKSFATNLSDAMDRLKRSPTIDLVFLEIMQSLDRTVGEFFGEELGAQIRKSFPGILIVVIMARIIPIRIRNIHLKVKPDGFFVLGDIHHLNMAAAYNKVLREPPFYSRSIAQSLIDFAALNFTLDEIDVQILKGLDEGLVMKEIAYGLSLARSTVVNRKQVMKLQFGVEYGNDRDLVNKARAFGFI